MLIKYLPVPKVSLRYLSNQRCADMVKVQVKQGTLVGKQKCLPNGKTFNSFKGIPYAKPPLGPLRFKSPVALEQFDVPELDCSEHRDVSHHRDPFQQEIIGSENCLYLNVYAPETTKQQKLPVMVWVHGGGYAFGSGNSESFYPLKLMEHEVIVVTLNYRLGALGFLYLPEEGIYGNAGLKDQRLALQWVHENIANFNGDANNVTLFGESAGASSVHLHAYADHANKYFHKAVMQSGTANMEWVFQFNPAYKTRRLAELVGCKSTNTRDILEFLQSDNVTAIHLLANMLAVLTEDERRRGLPLPFKPVVEDSNSPDKFISEPILDILQEKNKLKIPTIMGYNSAEGLAMLVNALRKLPIIEEDLERFIPRNIPLPLDSDNIKAIAQKMRQFYFKGGRINEKSLNELTNVLSDYHFTVDMQKAAELQVRCQTDAPLYFYRFDYTGKNNMYKRIFQMDKLNGACHGDELHYLFQIEDSEVKLSAKDEEMTNLMCQLWTNFAKFGKPTSVDPIVDWKPIQCPKSESEPFVLDYLSINNQCQMLQNPDQERIAFWRQIYRDLNATDYSKISAKL